MDVSKVKAAITNAQNELRAVADAEFKARRIDGLRPLAGADARLTQALAKLDDAVAKTQPKEKKEKTKKEKK